MTNEENINNIVSEVVIFGNEVSVNALKYALSLLARRKDQQFEENLEKLKHVYIKEYKEAISNDDDYVVGRAYGRMDAVIKINNELFPESEQDNSDRDE